MIKIFTKLLFSILVLTIHFLSAQTFEGIVTDVDNNPIPYANIQIGKTGVLSNEEGAFLIHVKNHKLTDSIKISYLGFESKKFILKNASSKKYILEDIRHIKQQYFITIKILRKIEHIKSLENKELLQMILMNLYNT